ncbi:hypothetical protein [Chryseobacterium daeguense]|uniref:hypothetical protein n=1 Tax=Chryseobacterium daeguense TaxID=412438 RepID=UPI00041324A8|nr:hypothetical protein [Chryseobacterium daeguense]
MKKILLCTCVSVFSLTYAQVGINNANPQGSLHVDGAKDNPATGTVSAAQQANDLIFTKTGKLGIGTLNPTAQLQTTGNMILGAAASTSGTGGFSSVVRDNTTGELKVLTTNSGNAFPLNYVTYNINNVKQDWVADFNTNIPTSEYTVVVTGSSFTTGGPTHLTSNVAKTYNPINIYAFQSGGTWRIQADYQGGATEDNGDWTIYCLVINKNIIKNLGSVSSDLGGTNVGSAAVPAGL